VLKYDLTTREITSTEYWNAFDSYNLPTLNISYKEAKSELEKLMFSAFNYRMVSDVPVGVFLSGGYDSTAVAALLSKGESVINTYTIGFDNEKYNEADYAKQVAKHLGTNHNEYYCSYSDALQIIPELPEIYDEPFGDPSAIPTTLVSRIARKYVKVALSADAGDELFAGYPRHKKSLELINKLNTLPKFSQNALSTVADLMHFLIERNISKPSKFDKLSSTLNSKEIVEVFNLINQTFTHNEVKRLIASDFKVPNTIYNEDKLLRSDLSILNRILACEYRTYLTDDILQKVDRATMYNSLEGREPFLDHRLLEFVSRLPESYKFNEGKSKIILKDIVHDYVPKSIMERPKMGFGVPIENWLKSELKDLYEEVLDLDKIKKQGVLNVDTITQLKRGFINNEVKDIYRLWFVFVFQLWYDRWMN
jgi:asparagine synthase (glutamine-hydrolysing)